MSIDPKVEKAIKNKLTDLQVFAGIKILYSLESGSRAWGIESVDSDYDVRFIYISGPRHYLALEDMPDNLRPTNDTEYDLDIHGWDLQKALRLFRGGNPNLLEWLESPYCYLEHTDTIDKMRQLVGRHFSKTTSMHHYHSMAVKTFDKYLKDEQVMMKKYFYVLRPILACEWTRRFGTKPPIEFESLVKYCVDDSQVKIQIRNLTERKRAGEELGIVDRCETLHNFIAVKMESLAFYLRTMPKERYNKAPWQTLNFIFEDALKEAWLNSDLIKGGLL